MSADERAAADRRMAVQMHASLQLALAALGCAPPPELEPALEPELEIASEPAVAPGAAIGAAGAAESASSCCCRWPAALAGRRRMSPNCWRSARAVALDR